MLRDCTAHGNGRHRQLTIPLHTDRIELVGESERLLAAGERGRYAASPQSLFVSCRRVISE
jgi:hypothetical protein